VPLGREAQAEMDARRARIAELWGQGLTASQIAARLGTTEIAVQGHVVHLQAKGVIAKRIVRVAPMMNRVTHGPGRPRTCTKSPAAREADKVRAAAAFAGEVANQSWAKRVVTISQDDGEMRIIRFFADPDAALGVQRSALTGVCRGVVVRDEVYARRPWSQDGGGWQLWRLITGAPA
jgi:hypothetical protein